MNGFNEDLFTWALTRHVKSDNVSAWHPKNRYQASNTTKCRIRIFAAPADTQIPIQGFVAKNTKLALSKEFCSIGRHHKIQSKMVSSKFKSVNQNDTLLRNFLRSKKRTLFLCTVCSVHSTRMISCAQPRTLLQSNDKSSRDKLASLTLLM